MGTNHGLGPMAWVRCTWLAVHGAQHFPQRREAAFQAVLMWMSMHHGGARTGSFAVSINDNPVYA